MNGQSVLPTCLKCRQCAVSLKGKLNIFSHTCGLRAHMKACTHLHVYTHTHSSCPFLCHLCLFHPLLEHQRRSLQTADGKQCLSIPRLRRKTHQSSVQPLAERGASPGNRRGTLQNHPNWDDWCFRLHEGPVSLFPNRIAEEEVTSVPCK